MKFSKIKIPKKISISSFRDKRGKLLEIFSQKKFQTKFIYNIITFSKKNVIRGLHFKKKQEPRIVTVIKGLIFDYAVSIKKNSIHYKKIYKNKLKEGQSIYIPAGYAHGYSCHGKENIVLYHLASTYNQKLEDGIIWNDKNLQIKWNIKKPIMSKRDKSFKNLK